MQKCLGVDVGKKQVGIAISDDKGSLAFPLEIVTRRECVEQLLKLIDKRNIQVVVFGKSIDLDGKDNTIMTDVREIADTIATREKTVIAFEPEQFSTQAAGRLGKGNDAEAAAVILQSYLDRKNTDREEVINF